MFNLYFQKNNIIYINTQTITTHKKFLMKINHSYQQFQQKTSK